MKTPEGRSILLHTFPVLDSTSCYVRQLIPQGAREGLVVMAREQRQGRGQRGRAWASPPGGFYCSLLLTPQQEAMPGFSLVASLAVVRAIQSLVPVQLSIKWPNDLYLEGGKAGGILCELLFPHLIIGCGLNILRPPTMSCSGNMIPAFVGDYIQGDLDPEDLLWPVVQELYSHYTLFLEKGFLPFREALEELSFLQEKEVIIQENHQEIKGRVEGLSPEGALQLRLSSGEERTLYSGTVLYMQEGGR